MIRFENNADTNKTTISFEVDNELELPGLSRLIERIEGANVIPGRQAQEAPQTRSNLVWVSWVLHKVIGKHEQ